MIRPSDDYKKKVDNVPADHWIKIKENEKRDKYLDLARELKCYEHESEGETDCN